jgi:polygalacturonase
MILHRRLRASVLSFSLSGAWFSVHAQDTRTVTEPTVPASCAVLTASLVPVADTTVADGDERALDTERIQKAIDGCGNGKAVVLRGAGAKRAFLTGPLELKSGVTLVVDTNTILFGSRDPRLYDVTPGACGKLAQSGRGCFALIRAEKANHSGIMGKGTIDGRGWASLLNGSVSWWELAQQARNGPLTQNCPRLFQTLRSDDITLYQITLRNPGQFHVVFDRGDGFTAWGVTINTVNPIARNTDGIDPASSKNITITHSIIRAGDDNIAIKGGSTGPTSNMTVSHNHFFRGHGMSIGSETNGGVDHIFVTDLSVDGADNGLRIKSNASRGGLVHHVTYEDVCIRNTKEPILMDTHYTASAETTGSLIPVFRDIVLRDIRIIDGGKITFDGYDDAHRMGMMLDGVVTDAPEKTKVMSSFLDLTIAAGGPMTLPFGDRATVHTTGASGTAGRAPNACTGKFIP